MIDDLKIRHYIGSINTIKYRKKNEKKQTMPWKIKTTEKPIH